MTCQVSLENRAKSHASDDESNLFGALMFKKKPGSASNRFADVPA